MCKLRAEMGIDRRTFLRKASLACLTLGITETGIASLAKTYTRTLAQTTNRKLALLVGINQYSQTENLKGCLTDIELQRELLIHRFGFQPQDIYTLSDRQATRENIETAFVEHLIEQAQPGDVVVFHYSGYGGKVRLSEPSQTKSDPAETVNYRLVNSLIPTDGILPTKGMPACNDVLQDTLLGLGSSLATDNFVMVLDTSYGDVKGLQGNFRLRSYGAIAPRASADELAFRQQWQLRLANQNKNSTTIVPKGIILAAAQPDLTAAEIQLHGFSVGLFTYALTQHIWQAIPANQSQIIWQETAEAVQTWRDQQPQIIGSQKTLFTYYSTPEQPVRAEGVVTAIDNNGTVSLKLTGLPLIVADNYGINSCVVLVNEPSKTADPKPKSLILQIRSREKLAAKASAIAKETSNNEIKVGQVVQELVRVFPRNLGLDIALGKNLQRIERVDATSAFANVESVASVTGVGETGVDCLLGKVSLDQTESDSSHSYGLFSVTGGVIPNTVGEANEAVKSTISRLEPYLKSILAHKWLALTINETTSQLKVKATLTNSQDKGSKIALSGAKNAFFLQRSTQVNNLDKVVQKKQSSWEQQNFSLPVLSPNSQLQLALENKSDRSLYAMVFGIDSENNLIVMYTSDSKGATEASPTTAIAKQKQIPSQDTDVLKWTFSNKMGIVKIYALFSIAPFTNTLAALSLRQMNLEREKISNVINPLEVTAALLQDLHKASNASQLVDTINDVYALDVRAWASLRFVCRIE